jgi:hypothetical protein
MSAVQPVKASLATWVALGAKTVDKLGLFAKVWRPIEDTSGKLNVDIRVLRNIFEAVPPSSRSEVMSIFNRVRAEQPSNRPVGRDVIPVLNTVALLKDVQFWNALAP